MLDHKYIRPDGNKVPISEITDKELLKLLSCSEFEVVEPDNGETVNCLVERLKIEKIIRDNGWWIPPN